MFFLGSYCISAKVGPFCKFAWKKTKQHWYTLNSTHERMLCLPVRFRTLQAMQEYISLVEKYDATTAIFNASPEGYITPSLGFHYQQIKPLILMILVPVDMNLLVLVLLKPKRTRSTLLTPQMLF